MIWTPKKGTGRFRPIKNTGRHMNNNTLHTHTSKRTQQTNTSQKWCPRRTVASSEPTLKDLAQLGLKLGNQAREVRSSSRLECSQSPTQFTRNARAVMKGKKQVTNASTSTYSLHGSRSPSGIRATRMNITGVKWCTATSGLLETTSANPRQASNSSSGAETCYTQL
jgi:hypothetical protein